MPILRNPFARRPGGLTVPNDENARPGSSSSSDPDTKKTTPGFERVDTIGSKSSTALSVRSQDTGEYKMSVVNDSGVYLPPSPTQEKEQAWPRRYLARNSTDTRSSEVGEIEHFSISRESFDSYRRSFDISARSPVIDPAAPLPRQSLDSARFPRMSRASLGGRGRHFEREPPTAEEGFEDVGLNDDLSRQLPPPAQQQQLQQRRKGFFSKFGAAGSSSEQPHQQDSSGALQPTGVAGSGTNMSRFLPGRKRGHSGQGAELGNWPAGQVAGQGKPPQQQQSQSIGRGSGTERSMPGNAMVEQSREEVVA